MDQFRVSAPSREEGRYRVGRRWPAEGALVGVDDLTAEEWEALAADPLLRIERVEAGEADTDAGEAAKEELVRAISELPPEGFGADGKPKLDALRAALPNLKVSAALRDEVWAEVKVSAD